MASDLKPAFARLREILRRHSPPLSVSEDTTSKFCLECGSHPQHKRPMPLAWVNLGKSYVSYHLMPVYACPRLLENCSPKLRARMQGKSCFNFKSVDEPLFEELEQLTADGLVAFRKAGHLPDPRS